MLLVLIYLLLVHLRFPEYKVHFLLVDHGIRKNSTKEALNVKNILEKKEIKLKENSLAYNHEVIPIILPTTKFVMERKEI